MKQRRPDDFAAVGSHAGHNNQKDSILRQLDPSLWNSPLGRRAFLKRTGAATVGTAAILHGLNSESLASSSAPHVYPEYRLLCVGDPESLNVGNSLLKDNPSYGWMQVIAANPSIGLPALNVKRAWGGWNYRKEMWSGTPGDPDSVMAGFNLSVRGPRCRCAGLQMQFQGDVTFHARHKGTTLAHATDQDEAVLKISQWSGDIMVNDQNVPNPGLSNTPDFSGSADVDAKPGSVWSKGSLTPTEEDLNSLSLSAESWGAGLGAGWSAQTHSLSHELVLNWNIMVQVRMLTSVGGQLYIPPWPTTAEGTPIGEHLSQFLASRPAQPWVGELPSGLASGYPSNDLQPST